MGAVLAVGGGVVVSFLPPQSDGIDLAFAGRLLNSGLGLLFAGLALVGLGELFQKMKHDEWSLRGYRFPRGSQVKCARCRGLMNADTRVCPFCGFEIIQEPLTWSPVDPATASKSTETAPSSQDV